MKEVIIIDIYIKLKEKLIKTESVNVRLSDLCDVVCDDKKVNDIIITTLIKDEYRNYSVSSVEIIKKILNYNKDMKVNVVGLTETIIEYKKKEKQNKLLNYMKTFIVCVILFAGASTAIMSFHNETALPDVFDTYYKMFFGYESNNQLIIHIPYSIGLAIGIIVFFNHVFGKRFSEDPTPIEVEMVKYESDQCKAENKILEHKKIKSKKLEGRNYD